MYLCRFYVRCCHTLNNYLMKRILIVLILLPSVFSAVTGQVIFKIPKSTRTTMYSIDAKLDPATATVDGQMKAYWINRSSDIVDNVRMHLYLNAFRNSRSTFYREMGDSPGKSRKDAGWIDIKSITGRDGSDMLPMMQYISPDDGNKDDKTVIRIDLPEPAKPGDTVFLNIDFESKLPSRIIRTGYSGNFFFVAQWFPKFGVYEPAGMRYATTGGWNCHQFHSRSEFYADPGIYDVTITLPDNYVVGTCGMLMKETRDNDGEKTLEYRAEDIVDFAWTAWPGYSVFTDHWNDVQITLLLPGERKDQVDRQMKAVKYALEYFSENVGPYPWPYVTIVDPPTKGAGAGGMEYTTLFTSESVKGVPSYLHLPEMVTIHEFGHAYFMGILESNEFEEPWLDEGVNTFWENRIVDHYYGASSGLLDHPWLKVSDSEVTRMRYVRSGSRQASTNRLYSWQYPHGTYSMMSYSKTAVVLNTLMGIIGEETMNEIFREYYREWAFKHPSGQDLIDVANEVNTRMNGDKFGPDLNWFFSQTLFGTGICDYRVSGLVNNKPVKTWADSLPSASDSIYNSKLQLERTGDVMLPEEILVHFSDGHEVTEKWDGKSRTKDFSYTGKYKVLWAKIDPDYKITMDVNYINNSKTVDPDRVPERKLADKFITFIQFFLNFLSL